MFNNKVPYYAAVGWACFTIFLAPPPWPMSCCFHGIFFAFSGQKCTRKSCKYANGWPLRSSPERNVNQIRFELS